MDLATTGPDIVVRFPFDEKAARPLNDLAEVRGKDIAFLKEFQKGQTVFTEVEGFGAAASDYDFRLENRKTGAGVRITGDRPLVKVYFWSANLTVCPEPYIDVSADPARNRPGASRISSTRPQAAKETSMMNRRDAITSMSIAGGASLIPSGEAIAGAITPGASSVSSRRCAAPRRSRFATSRPS